MWTNLLPISLSPILLTIAMILSILLGIFVIRKTARLLLGILPIPHHFVISMELFYCGFIILTLFVANSYILRPKSQIYDYLKVAEGKIEAVRSDLPKYSRDDLTDNWEAIMNSAGKTLSSIRSNVSKQIESFQVRSTPTPIVYTSYPITLTSQSLAAQYVIEQVTLEERSILFKIDVRPTVDNEIGWSGTYAQQQGLSLRSMDSGETVEIMNIGGIFSAETPLLPDRKNFAWVRFHRPDSLRVQFSYGDMGTINLDLRNSD